MERITVAFILSLGRSGSTWLNVVLGSNSWAANVGECFRIFSSSSQVTCRLCEADGLSACTKLHGFENVAREDAYSFAAERLKRRVIIDSSKRLDWCSFFLERAEIDARLIHLVRHPCGFIASQRRRFPERSAEEFLGEWERKNAAIADFSASSGAPTFLASYDHLIDAPDENFPDLCSFLGHAWEASSLQYWKVPHHGLGGNGANSLYLRNRKVRTYETGDDTFYASLLDREPSADRRWMSELPHDFCRMALARPYAVEMQRKVGAWEAP